MKKCLLEITEEECRIICEIYGESFITFNTHESKYYGLVISILTTTTLNHESNYDSSIKIYIDGKVILSRNSGGWDGYKTENISALMVTDFLRSRGYIFEYKLPKKVERKIKLLNISNI